MKTPTLTVVGAGPGDADLITLKAIKALKRADVILYDALINTELLAYASEDAELIFVGKRKGCYAFQQDQINDLIVSKARQKGHVVRLKGGDPFVFGRGGEEIELLAQEGIPFQVVPGITAANAAACYAGVPLTHRDYAQSVRFVTGHTKDGKLEHRWEEFQSESETLVFYMGLVGLPIIAEELQRHGRRADTPIALVERATRSDQRLITGTLSTICDIVEEADVQPPTLIIVGNVVELADKLRWYGEQ